MGQINKTNFDEYSKNKVVDTIECSIESYCDTFILNYTDKQLLDVVRSLGLNIGDTVVLTIKKKEG